MTRQAYYFSMLLLFCISPLLFANPIFDVHIHYSHDVWDKIPAERAVQKLREAGIQRALVSSSSDEGTQRLYQQAPDLVIPSLRPYRKRGELDSWMYDESLIPYLQDRLKRYHYAAIGEFHISEAHEVELPVIQALLAMASQYQLVLHAHCDANSVERLFKHNPKARILWAHAGFESAARVKQMLQKYPQLWVDLSFRWEIYNGHGRFLPGWEALLINHGDRFMLGVDTYTPMRWLEIKETIDWYESLFAALPAKVAQNIRYDNAARLLPLRPR